MSTLLLTYQLCEVEHAPGPDSALVFHISDLGKKKSASFLMR